MNKKINSILEALNPDFLALSTFIERNVERLKKSTNESEIFSEKHNVLITYADQFQSKDKTPLQSLNHFLNDDLKGCMSHVHILPFYPWTSDDGFSSICFKNVSSDYGSWDDVSNIKQDKMFDCVFNHVSSENEFFKEALKGSKKHQDMFHIVEKERYEQEDFQELIPLIVRPRTSPLFSEYEFNDGMKYVWTTFSKDQVDTNIGNLDMVRYILESLFLYIEKGATFFRIDAVPFMWKELGTNCSHLPKTHLFVKLMRSIVEEIGSNMLIITESNVPHEENITYWGNGDDEAHVIYNFSLAPLVLHSLVFKDATYINEWANNVFNIGEKVTYLNFTATHDGIGMRGLEGVVPESDVEVLCELAQEQGGQIGKKRSRDGSIKPYELNCTWASILDDESLDEESQIRKIVNSHAIVMFFPGIGAHYVHNFFGTKNWQEGFKESGIARRLNRKKLQYPLDLSSREEKIKSLLIELINMKSSNEAFHPKASFEVVDAGKSVLSFIRERNGKKSQVYFNLSESEISTKEVTLKPYELLIV